MGLPAGLADKEPQTCSHPGLGQGWALAFPHGTLLSPIPSGQGLAVPASSEDTGQLEGVGVGVEGWARVKAWFFSDGCHRIGNEVGKTGFLGAHMKAGDGTGLSLLAIPRSLPPCCWAGYRACLALQGEGVWEGTTGCPLSLVLLPGPGKREGPFWVLFGMRSSGWTWVLDISRGVMQNCAHSKGWRRERKQCLSLCHHTLPAVPGLGR